MCDIYVANRDDTVVKADADSATAPHRPSQSIARDRPMWKNNPHRPGNINVVTVPDVAVESRPSDFDVASVNWIGCVKTNSRQSFECAEFDEQCDDGKPQSRRYRDLLVNGVKVTCTSDSGSQICLVRRSVVGENVVECGKIVIQTAFGACVPATLIKVRIKPFVDDRNVANLSALDIVVAVVEELNCTEDVILCEDAYLRLFEKQINADLKPVGIEQHADALGESDAEPAVVISTASDVSCAGVDDVTPGTPTDSGDGVRGGGGAGAGCRGDGQRRTADRAYRTIRDVIIRWRGRLLQRRATRARVIATGSRADV